jgi:hypothetical protein
MKIIYIILLVLATNQLFAQSKKEQINLMQNQIDSLKHVVQFKNSEIEFLKSENNANQINFQKALKNEGIINNRIVDSLNIVIGNLDSHLVVLTQKCDSLSSTKKSDLFINDEMFYGNWGAYSKVYWENGNFCIKNGQLIYEKYGIVDYELIHYNGKEYLLKLNKDINGDNLLYLKLGVIYNEDELNTFMEVAFYETEKDGLNDMIMKRSLDEDEHHWNPQIWGLYEKY